MNNDQQNVEKLFDDLPSFRSEEEIRSLYAKRLEDAKARYSFAIDNRMEAKTSLAALAIDAVVKLYRNAKGDVAQLLEWSDKVVSNILPAPAEAFAFTRSLVCETQNEASRQLLIEKGGVDCTITAKLLSKGSVADVEISMQNSDATPLLPFTLQIRDGENGEVLLPERQFTTGAATIKGLTKGIYAIDAESGDKKAGLTLKINA